jgi:peptidoglycan/LPS O-acetylase OafA/YrhL
MAAAMLLGRALGLELSLLSDSILWSLVCEEIYYLLYPLLLRLMRVIGLLPLIAAAYVASVLVVVWIDPRAGNYASYGCSFNWLVGLPCWLCGCALAAASPRAAPSPRVMWLTRAGIWFTSSVTCALRFHSPLKYPWTLNPFALVATLWIVQEIAFARHRPPPAWLEKGGKWSYSIYLCHLHADALFRRLHVPFLGEPLNWIVRNAFYLVVCYAFYRLVERPSHELARATGRRLLAATPASATGATA